MIGNPAKPNKFRGIAVYWQQQLHASSVVEQQWKTQIANFAVSKTTMHRSKTGNSNQRMTRNKCISKHWSGQTPKTTHQHDLHNNKITEVCSEHRWWNERQHIQHENHHIIYTQTVPKNVTHIQIGHLCLHTTHRRDNCIGNKGYTLYHRPHQPPQHHIPRTVGPK